MLLKRVITALVGLPLVVAAAWFGSYWFAALVAIWAALAAYEFFHIVNTTTITPLTYFGIAWVIVFIISPIFHYDFLTPLLTTAAIMLPLIILLARRKKENAFASWVWTVGGIFYLGWLLSYYPLLRNLDIGRDWVFLAFLATFASDTAAYFVGRAWGKHPLAPIISPKKTWEGAIGGVLGAVISVEIFAASWWPLHISLGWGQAIIIGIIISVFGQLGDLVKSLFKRNMGVKDSSNMLPGHGGFLDRIDSVIFAGVVVYYYVIWMVH